MSDRDELVELIGEEWDPAEIVAERILDHGYTKPRTITTAEEMDGLSAGAVMLDKNNAPWQVIGDVTDGTEPRYDGIGATYYTTSVFLKLYGPFDIIHAPEPAP